MKKILFILLAVLAAGCADKTIDKIFDEAVKADPLLMTSSFGFFRKGH